MKFCRKYDLFYTDIHRKNGIAEAFKNLEINLKIILFGLLK